MNSLKRTTWKLHYMLLAAFFTLIVGSSIFLPCRCWRAVEWRVRGDVAEWVVYLIVGRFVVAWAFGEKNNGWMYYLAFLIASPFLVATIFEMITPMHSH